MIYESVIEKKRLFFILLTMAVLCTFPLFNDFMIYSGGHDLKFHLARIEGIYAGLKAGEFPVYINSVQANGYGYASPIMNPQLFLYIPAVLRLCGFSLMNSYKVFILLLNIATVFIAYFSYKRMLRSGQKGLLAAAIYTFSIYRLSNIYTRGAIGESLAMAFLPMVICGIYECIWGSYQRWYWLALGFTFVIHSHIISVEICLGFCVLMALVGVGKLLREKKRILAILKAAGLAFLLCFSYIVPWFAYRGENFHVFGEKRYLGDSAIYISQMFEQFVNRYGGENVGRGTTAGEMPLSLGIMILFGVILFLLFVIGSKWKENRESSISRLGIICLVLGVFALWMCSDLFPWFQIHTYWPLHDVINKFLFPIQFAWRFLGIASAFLVVPAAIGWGRLAEIEEKQILNSKAIIVITLIVITAAFPYMDQLLQSETLEVEEKTAYGEGWTDELYMYADDSLYNLEQRGTLIYCFEDPQASFDQVSREGSRWGTNITLSQTFNDSDSLIVEVPVYYYPGYKAMFNGSEVPVTRGNMGVVQVHIPAENGRIEVCFDVPILWQVSNFVSFISCVLLIVVVIFRRKAVKCRFCWLG